MYMPGRRRTGSSPSRTVMSLAVYAIKRQRIVPNEEPKYECTVFRHRPCSLPCDAKNRSKHGGKEGTTMRFPLKIGLAVALTIGGASQAQAQMRFRGMDTNNDGVI